MVAPCLVRLVKQTNRPVLDAMPRVRSTMSEAPPVLSSLSVCLSLLATRKSQKTSVDLGLLTVSLQCKRCRLRKVSAFADTTQAVKWAGKRLLMNIRYRFVVAAPCLLAAPACSKIWSAAIRRDVQGYPEHTTKSMDIIWTSVACLTSNFQYLLLTSTLPALCMSQVQASLQSLLDITVQHQRRRQQQSRISQHRADPGVL